jgi:hypothetical protein
MEALNDPTRPLYQRATEMIVPPLSPLEVGEMLKLEPSDAFDAYLVTGGLPIVCGEWRSGQSRREYLKAALSTSTSALVVSGFRALDAEFPTTAQARSILNVIGSGERTFTNIANKIDGIKEMPILTKPSKESRYRVADPYLRFWLRFIGPNMDEIDRGQGNRVLKMIDDS